MRVGKQAQAIEAQISIMDQLAMLVVVKVMSPGSPLRFDSTNRTILRTEMAQTLFGFVNAEKEKGLGGWSYVKAARKTAASGIFCRRGIFSLKITGRGRKKMRKSVAMCRM